MADNLKLFGRLVKIGAVLLILTPLFYFLYLYSSDKGFGLLAFISKLYIIIIPIITYLLMLIITLVSSIQNQNKIIYPILLSISFILIPLGLVVIAVYWMTGKDSSRVDKELREAQLKALNKGNVNIEIKGKMKKL